MRSSIVFVVGAAAGAAVTALVVFSSIGETGGSPGSSGSDDSAQVSAQTSLTLVGLESGIALAAGDNPAVDASAFPRGEQRWAALYQMGMEMARRDVDQALEAGRELGTLAEQEAYYRGAIAEWASTEPEAAWSFAISQDSPGFILSLGEEALAVVVKSDVQLAARLLERVTSAGVRETLEGELSSAFAQAMPAEAARWAAGLGGGSRAFALGEVAQAWATQDPDSAVTWTMGLRDSKEREQAIRGLTRAWAKDAPEDAAQWASRLGDPTDRLNAMSELSADYGFYEPEKTLQWLAKMEDLESYRGDIAAVTSYLTEVSPQRAVKMAQELPASLQGSALESVAGTWAGNAPNEALAWINSLEDLGLKARLAQAALATVAESDPEVAGEWAAAQEDTNLRDFSLLGISEALVVKDPLQSLNVAAQISDFRLRNPSLKALVQDLAMQSPTQAAKAVSALKLSAEEKSGLQGIIQEVKTR